MKFNTQSKVIGFQVCTIVLIILAGETTKIWYQRFLEEEPSRQGLIELVPT